MRRRSMATLTLALLLIYTNAPSPRAASGPTPPPAAHALALPLAFERNDGQHAPGLSFTARGDGYSFGFARDRVSVALAGSHVRFSMRMLGAQATAPVGESPQPGIANYLIGPDSARWRTAVPTFARVRYRNVWTGIDAVFYGNGRQLEYDLVVAPGADPALARIDFEGAAAARIDSSGALRLTVDDRGVRYSPPIAYQIVDGQRRAVEATYVLTDQVVSFHVGSFDRSHPLVIDPILVFSTFLGGSERDTATSTAVDGAGNIYLTGLTYSMDFPTSSGALDGSYGTGGDIFVTKISPDGSTLLYSTYIGGSGIEWGAAISVDARGSAFVLGQSEDGAFPTTAGAFRTTRPGLRDGVLFKLAPSGSSLLYSTYLGGSNDDAMRDVAIDITGAAYVAGGTQSTNFPTTPGVMGQVSGGGEAAFVLKLNAAGSTLIYSTYIIGDFGVTALALDVANQPILVGSALFYSGTITPPEGVGEGRDAFVAKVNGRATDFVWSRRFGGRGFEVIRDVGVTVSNEVVIVGETSSSDLPVTVTADRSEFGGLVDGFLAVLEPSGREIMWSTYLGGSAADYPTSVGVAGGDITVFGRTESVNFPVREPVQPTLGGSSDGFIARYSGSFDSMAETLRDWSTYFGGNGYDYVTSGVVDGAGRTTFVGSTTSPNLPLRNAMDSTFGTTPGENAFVGRIALAEPGSVSTLDVVVHVADAAIRFGNWQRADDPTAAGGARLYNPDAGLPRPAAPLAAPTDYFEFDVEGLTGGPYRVWVRGRAQNNSYTNDSVWIQFDNANDDYPDEGGGPIFRTGTTQAMPVIIEECGGCDVRGWGWQDDGYGKHLLGTMLFFDAGTTRVRVQRREDGVSIDQIVFSKAGSPYDLAPPGYQKDDVTILPATTGGGDLREIVLYAAVDSPRLSGAWRIVDDPTAAGGKRLHHPDVGAPKINAPLANPTHYVDLTFEALAGVTYKWHLRGKAQRDDPYNDSVYVQFSNAIGTTQATAVNLEVCSGAGLAGWGWRDGQWCAPSASPGTAVVFANSGTQTIRIQTREDGISIDQVVISADKYAASSPGAVKNDTTIVPR